MFGWLAGEAGERLAGEAGEPEAQAEAEVWPYSCAWVL